MASKYVLDAHAAIWYLEGNARLSPNAKSIIDDRASEMVLAIIALCEAVQVIGKGRTKIKNREEFLDWVSRDPRFEIAPLTTDVVRVPGRVVI